MCVCVCVGRSRRLGKRIVNNAASSKGLNAREKQKTGKEDMRYWVGVEFTFKWPRKAFLEDVF